MTAMKIYLPDKSGELHAIAFDSSDPIEEIRRVIQQTMGITDDVVLLCEGEMLADGHLLADYGLGPENAHKVGCIFKDAALNVALAAAPHDGGEVILAEQKEMEARVDQYLLGILDDYEGVEGFSGTVPEENRIEYAGILHAGPPRRTAGRVGYCDGWTSTSSERHRY